MMHTEDLLTETFTDYERLAPDPDLVRTQLYHRLRGRRRQVRRSLAVLTAAAAAAAVTVVGVQLGGAGIGRPADAPTATASGPTGPTAPGTQTSARPRPAQPAPLPDTFSLGPGWLPAGAREVVDENGFGRQARGFLLAGGGPHSYILITAETGGLPDEGYGGTPRDLRIDGKPAREFQRNAQYYIAVQVAPDRIVTAYVGNAGGAEQEMAIGRRVARNLRLDRRDRIRLPFGLTYLPAGTSVRGFTRDTTIPETRLLIGGPTARVEGETSFMVWESADDPEQYGFPRGRSNGRPVQGHPTKVHDNRQDGSALWVQHLVGGRSIMLTGGPGALPELYKLAAGIRPGA